MVSISCEYQKGLGELLRYSGESSAYNDTVCNKLKVNIHTHIRLEAKIKIQDCICHQVTVKSVWPVEIQCILENVDLLIY